ncbi:MAG: YicC/YloC family endoribonuclease, partial [bacterium]
MSIRSMTGFARVRRQSPDGEAVVTVKSVNHRGLDLHFQMPGVLDPYEPVMRGLIRKRMSRGHIEIRVQYHRNRSQTASSLNHELLDNYLAAFREAGHRHSITAEPDLNAALRIPGMFEPAVDQEPEAEFEAFLVGLLDEALTELNRVREREGAETAAVLAERTKAIREATATVRDIRSRALPAFQQRLKD